MVHLRATLTRCSTSRVLVLGLACVILCAFSLKRALERTPINQETAGFKFSKTLDLPNKKADSIPVAAVLTDPATPDAAISECVLPSCATDLYHDIVARSAYPRGPPFVGTF